MVLGVTNFDPTKGFLDRDAIVFILCGLVISNAEAADQTCKAKATEQRLAGAALFSFVKRCEVDAQMACAEAAHKMLAEPASETSSIRASRKQSGQGLDGACHTIVATTPTARVARVVRFAGLASADNKVDPREQLVDDRIAAGRQEIAP